MKNKGKRSRVWGMSPKKTQKSKKIVKKTEIVKKVSKPNLVFFKLDVGSKESLKFFTDLFKFLKFNLVYQDEQQVHFTNDNFGFVVYHMFNVTGSGIYVLNTGVNALFFKVQDKQEVDRFYSQFLKVRRIPIKTNSAFIQEEGEYSIFFETPEKITIGIISD